MEGVPKNGQIRLLVVDDHPVVREGIKTMLSTDRGIEIIGEASNGIEAVQKVTELCPDVVLMDVMMPEMDGIEATRQVKGTHPQIAVVMLTMCDNDLRVIEAVRSGAVGYLLKDASRELLLHTVKAARSGGTLIKSSLLHSTLGGRVGESRAQTITEAGPILAPATGGLTARELEVLELLTLGQTNKEIGQALHITEQTVKKHVASIIDKLGACNRSDAAVRAVRAGLVHRQLDVCHL